MPSSLLTTQMYSPRLLFPETATNRWLSSTLPLFFDKMAIPSSLSLTFTPSFSHCTRGLGSPRDVHVKWAMSSSLVSRHVPLFRISGVIPDKRNLLYTIRERFVARSLIESYGLWMRVCTMMMLHVTQRTPVRQTAKKKEIVHTFTKTSPTICEISTESLKDPSQPHLTQNTLRA